MEIRLYGRYYYRDQYHIPHPITIVEKASAKGFYWAVKGHLYKHQIFEKKPERFMIYVSHIII